MPFLENETTGSPEACAWALRRTLLLQITPNTPRSMVVRTSGTGTGGVYTLSGSLLNSQAALSRPLAWEVIQGRPYEDPIGSGRIWRREFCFQHNGNGGLRVTYSPRAGFVAGSPSASQVPSASDAVPLVGGGSDSAPIFSSFFPSAGSRMQGYVSDETDSCVFVTYRVGGGPLSSFFCLDPIADTPRDLAGELEDRDPIAVYAISANEAMGLQLAQAECISRESLAPRGMLGYGTPGALWARIPPMVGVTHDVAGIPQIALPGALAPTILRGSSPTYADEVPRYVRRAALSGVILPGEQGNATTCDVKGYSTTLLWQGTTYSNPTLLDSVDSATREVIPGGLLAVGHLAFRWSGTPILV